MTVAAVFQQPAKSRYQCTPGWASSENLDVNGQVLLRIPSELDQELAQGFHAFAEVAVERLVRGEQSQGTLPAFHAGGNLVDAAQGVIQAVVQLRIVNQFAQSAFSGVYV